MEILVIKPSSLGDVIHSLPFLKSLKDTFKDVHIDWVISKNLAEILENHPLINNLIIFDKDSWKSIKNLPKTTREAGRLIRTLRSKKYDMVIDLQGLLRSGIITGIAQSPVKIGFDNAREGSRCFYNKKIHINDTQHAVDRYLEVAKSIGANSERIGFPLVIDESVKERVKSLTGDLKEYVVIVPSARWETKRWHPENFARLVSEIGIPCVIAGSKSDKQIAKHILDSSGGKCIDLSGKTDLKELAALIAKAKAVISNDSGPMHIAAALGVPVIALFGPTDPEKTGPYGWKNNKNLKVIRTSVPCSPCFKKKCKDPVCMSGITVEKVLEETREYL